MAIYSLSRRSCVAQHLALGECSSPSCAALYLFYSHLLSEVSAADKPALCGFPIHLHGREGQPPAGCYHCHKKSRTTCELLPVAVVVKFVVTCKRNEHPKSCTQGVKDLGGSIDPNLAKKRWKSNEYRHDGGTSIENHILWDQLDSIFHWILRVIQNLSCNNALSKKSWEHLSSQ